MSGRLIAARWSKATWIQVRKCSSNPICFVGTVFDSSASLDGGTYHLSAEISNGLRRQERLWLAVHDERRIGPLVVKLQGERGERGAFIRPEDPTDAESERPTEGVRRKLQSGITKEGDGAVDRGR